MTKAMSRIEPARRTEHITYAVRDVVVLAEQVAATGKDMLYLNIGDPNLFDFRTPDHVVQAVMDAMKANHCGYGPTCGTAEARRAIQAEAERKGIRGIRHVYVTTGASEAIDVAFSALVDPGQNVLVPTPGYPLYGAILNKLGAEEKHYFLDESNGWQPDVDDIAAKIDDNTRAIVIVNPNNPTGSLAERATLEAIIDLAGQHGLVVLADEIYDKLIFDGRESTPMASLSDQLPILTFNGLSKAYLAPGFRIGWGIVSGPAGATDDFVEAMNKMLRARLSAPHPTMWAIPAALEGDQSHLTEVMAKLTRRRELTVQMLNAIDGISCVRPGGAFYAFPRLEIDRPDAEFASELLRETGVVIVPGSGFGERPGSKHMRVVFLPPEDVLEQAYKKMDAFMSKFRAS